MAGWWETPYKGGPMAVPAAMFPRPLYPPDASGSGRTPSTDGPDTEAYKRTLWRLGRWPGPASRFDRAYSNGFAHGTGPNVVETGIAGFQRQMRIEDTGWVGHPTFNALASARVPEGRPHAGEMAMDPNAQNLVAQAFDLYGGHPEAEPIRHLVRELALEAAISDLGYTETPAGSNGTRYGSWYGMDLQPWCAMAVTYWFDVDAGGSPSFSKTEGRYAYVPYIVEDARNQRNGLSVVSTPVPGDLVCYDWAWDGTYDHVGVFEAWAAGSGATFTAIEGNTSTSDQSNGGEVMRRTRRVPDQATLFIRVAEP